MLSNYNRVLLLCSLALTTLIFTPATQAHPGHRGDHPRIQTSEKLLQNSKQIRAQLAQARAQAPRLRGNSCSKTLNVPGQGPSCLRPDGSWQISIPGEDIITHGADEPVAGSGVVIRLDSQTQSRFNAASKSDIVCATDSTKARYQAIYAYPAGTSARTSTIVPIFQRELYKASAFIDMTAQRQQQGRRARLPMNCDASGAPSILVHQLPTSASSDSFSTIVSDLRNKGYNSNVSAPTRYIVYYDARIGGGTYGYGGQGHIIYDESASATNRSNTSTATYALNYYAYLGRPDWAMLLHETLHTMGAVQKSAPQSTGAGHCNVDADVMCYSDGGPSGSTTRSVCTYTQLDCGSNTYFHAGQVPAGSYLATHWNVGSSINRFLHHADESEQPIGPDILAPTAPTNLQLHTATATSITVRWSAASDNVAVSGYELERQLPDGSWQRYATAATEQTITGLAPLQTILLRVRALDGASNFSPWSQQTSVSTAADQTAPTQPTNVRVLANGGGSVSLGWQSSVDDVAVTSYRIWWQSSTGWRQIGSTSRLAVKISSLRAGSTYTFAIQAVDAAGNGSPLASIRLVAVA